MLAPAGMLRLHLEEAWVLLQGSVCCGLAEGVGAFPFRRL